MTQATELGRRPYWTGEIVMYRLTEPLPDRLPERRNVVIVTEPGREPHAMGAAAYERADSSWAPVPRGSWVQCFAPLTAAERALVTRETGVALD